MAYRNRKDKRQNLAAYKLDRKLLWEKRFGISSYKKLKRKVYRLKKRKRKTGIKTFKIFGLPLW